MRKRLVLFFFFILTSTQAHHAASSEIIIQGDINPTKKYYAHIIAYRKRMSDLNVENPGEIIFRGKTEEKFIALTFDDGPNTTTTKQVLEILKELDVLASFFFIGNQLRPEHQVVVTQAIADGHTVLSHGWDHRRYTNKEYEALDKKIIQEDIEKGIESLSNSLQKPALPFMRPPYGDLTPEVLDVFKRLNITPILWSIDALDWDSEVTSDSIVENVVKHAHPGAIVLLHTKTNSNQTVEALGDIITQLRDNGYRFVTLQEMPGVMTK